MRIAVVGATGVVGRVMLEELEKSGLPIEEVLPAASEKSAGKKVRFKDKEYTIRTIEEILRQAQNDVEMKLDAERNNQPVSPVYPHPIDKNCIPQCDVFTDNGYTKEEMKVVNESRKILGIPDLQVTCTAVRVPVLGGHSEAVNVEFERDFDL